MEERKTLVMSWTKEQMDEFEDVNKFVESCLNTAALRIGYMAIQNPNQSFQWVGNSLKENEEAGTVSMYIKLLVRDEDATAYIEGDK